MGAQGFIGRVVAALLPSRDRVAAAIFLAPAGVAPLAAAESPRFEITPQAAYRVGGEFRDDTSETAFDVDEAGGLSLIVNGRVAEDSQWEVYLSRQSTDVDVDPTLFGSGDFELDVTYVHIGGNVNFDGPLGRPFFSGTVGATHLDPAGSDMDSETFISMALGGGLKFAPVRSLGLRMDLRLIGTLIGGDSDLFCLSNASISRCAFHVDGDVLWQVETSLGVSFRF